MARYVIIGGGIAGTTAAQEIRKLEPEAEITIIAREPLPLYSKVLLTPYVSGKVTREKLFLKKPEWYVEQKIAYMQGIEVTKIDTQNKFVETSEKREIPYDKLLITTGGEPRLLPFDLPGVTYFRTLEDAEVFAKLISDLEATVKPKDQQAVVYGGGFIALDCINILSEHNIKTAVAMRSGGFWSKALSEHSQKVLANHLEKQGVELFFNQPEIKPLGESELTGVQLADGEKIPAQLLVAGIGVEIDRKLLTSAGLEVERGIKADEYLKTNVSDVYAAGDVTEFYDIILGRHVQFGNWMNAQMQGRAVAKTMTGQKTKFELVSSFSTNVLGLEIVLVGDTRRSEADEIHQIVATPKESLEIFVNDGKIVGSVLIGNVSRRQELTDAIKNQKTYSA